MLYCNPSWLNSYLHKDKLLGKYDLWLAHWGVSSPDFDCTIWQYSENGSIPGISGSVDMNWIFKDYITKKPTKTKNGDKVKVINKTSFLRSQPIFDDMGGSSRKLTTLKIGTVCDFISDNGDGWSKVHANNTTGYIQNSRINGTGLSTWKKGTVLVCQFIPDHRIQNLVRTLTKAISSMLYALSSLESMQVGALFITIIRINIFAPIC